MRLWIDPADEPPILSPEAKRDVLGNVQSKTIHSVTRIAVPIRIQPTPRHMKDVLLHFGMQRALEWKSRPLRLCRNFFQLRKRLDTQSPFIAKLVCRRRGIVE